MYTEVSLKYFTFYLQNFDPDIEFDCEDSLIQANTHYSPNNDKVYNGFRSYCLSFITCIMLIKYLRNLIYSTEQLWVDSWFHSFCAK